MLQGDIPLLATLPASFANAFSYPSLTKNELEYHKFEASEDNLNRINTGMLAMPLDEGNLTIPLLAYRSGRIPGNNNPDNPISGSST